VWLLAGCAGQRRLADWPVPLQWLAVGAAGAACGAFAWAELLWLGQVGLRSGAGGRFGGLGASAALLSGAALAAAVFHWLRQRARQTLPDVTQARLAELQSRIRPHFLFNALNSAITLVQIDPTRAEAVLEDLAELFRAALVGSDAPVTLGEEIELAQRYLAIEQVRFGERLRAVWSIDAAALGARVPSLMLQPLVENAVKHGIEPAPDGGEIRVRAEVRRGVVLLTVTNSVPEARAARKGHGIALRNVRERLRLLHDVAGQCEVWREGGLFRARIVVPL
jgi:two-component system sensor histidine kinase AlgZ